MTMRGFSIETDFGADDVGRMLHSDGCLDDWGELAIRRLVKGGAICFDIGAHFGYYSPLFSPAVGAHEPVPEAFSFVIRNVAKNHARNVAIHQSAIGYPEDIVQFACGCELPLGWSRVRERGGVDVRCTTIDAEVSRQKLTRLDFVNIDVESYEPGVFGGAENRIVRLRPTVMFEVNASALREQRAAPTRISDILASPSYELFDAQKRKLHRTRQFPEECSENRNGTPPCTRDKSRMSFIPPASIMQTASEAGRINRS
jgi:FkbM family methyltransferase